MRARVASRGPTRLRTSSAPSGSPAAAGVGAPCCIAACLLAKFHSQTSLQIACHHPPTSMRMETSQSSKISNLAIFSRTPKTPGTANSLLQSFPIRVSSRCT